jgi:hypothetical protein
MRQFLDRIAMRSPARRSLLVACVVASVLSLPAASKANASQEAMLTAAAGTAEAKFGISVSISGDTAVVGAPDEGEAGAAYVFTRSDGIWTERATLVAPVRASGDKFGFNVAIAGDTAVVGAPNVDRTIPDRGVAYVFVGSGEFWRLQATLAASDATPGDALGFDVAISGDTVVAGAPRVVGNVVGVGPGAAYVFTRTGEAWSEQAKLTSSDASANDQFGYSVGVSGDTAAVGVVNDDIGAAVDQGSARVFTRSGSTWTQQAKLVAADGAPGDGMGFSISISGDTVATGAYLDDIGSNPKQGSAYVFVRNGASWAQQAKLTAPDGAIADLFGRALAVDRDTLVVGAHFDEAEGEHTLAQQGSAYVYNRVRDEWSAPTKLTAAAGGAFGVSVGVSGHTLIAGAGFTTVGNNANQGAAYVFRLRSAARDVTNDDRPAAKSSESATGIVQPATPPGHRLPETR